ncbi:MAG: AAA family ATPase, partial [Planctomycetota bacterium]|nr:AAA family ATPase [Planctomycetota bacterium]
TAAARPPALNQHPKYRQRPWTDADEAEQEQVRAGRSMPPPSAVASSTVTATPSTEIAVLKLTPASELYEASTTRPDYRVDPYVVDGHTSLLVSPPKAGKSTLVAHIIATMANGGGSLVGPIAPAKVLMLTEESRTLWAIRCKKLGIVAGVDFVFRWDVVGLPWSRVAVALAYAAREHGHHLVIVDTLNRFAGIDNENDPGLVTAAMKSLDAIIDVGKGVLAIHHTRKAGGSHGAGVRGSGAFVGCADIIIELNRIKGRPRHRRLTCLSRFDEVPPATIELSADGLSYTSPDNKIIVRRAVIDAVLTERPGLTRQEILDHWPKAKGSKPPSGAIVKLDLLAGVQESRYRTEGGGQRPGDAYRYYMSGQTPQPKRLVGVVQSPESEEKRVDN